MKIWISLTAALAIVAIMLAAIALGENDDTATGAPAGGGPAATPQTIGVELGDLFIKPATLTAEAGKPIVFDVKNGGAVQHNFSVEGKGATKMLRSGESAKLEIPALEPGTYRFLCEVQGHATSGMEGELVVGEATAAGGGDAGHQMTSEEMDASYLAGVAAFPAETAGLGNQPLQPVIDNGVKVFDLTADEIEWEVAPGDKKQGLAYNGMIPGPEIRVQLGDRVRVVLHNQTEESTAIHYHGLIVPNEMDGVPGITQPLVKPGESFTYEFSVRNAGSHMYHSHMNAAYQVPAGLLGAFVVEGPNEPQADHDVLFVLNDGPLGFTINGKGFPATAPIVAQQGQRIHVRYMNEGLQIHPMHLHGIPQTVIAKDGYPLPQPYTADTVLVAPGDRIDVMIEATELGVWAYHCHILNHAETEAGMFGMVTALIVQ